MERFTILEGVAAPLLKSNIDTGVIIALRFLRSRATDLGAGLFADWRYTADGVEIPDFVLNQPRYRESKILIAGANFGCGSSREAAVWALLRFGIRCVIAPSFGEIFYDNACENGLLPIVLPEELVGRLAARVEAASEPKLTVDLEGCKITAPAGAQIAFDVPEERRAALLAGLDETSLILQHEDEIDAYRAQAAAARPWLYGKLG
jgi:3-isopropylmalate/(R)-2-methylmalate dehydratase small subunit